MSRLPWLHYDSKGFCIGPRCGDCIHFTRERRSPLFDDREIYDCWTCPHANHIWSDGRRWTCSSQFACFHFQPRVVLDHNFFNDNEVVGDQLTLF